MQEPSSANKEREHSAGTASGSHTCDVFVSYSHVDRAVVAPLVKLLRVTHACVFRDEESIALGSRWQRAIDQSIYDCHTMVVFWSSAAADSKAVSAEYLLAIKLNKDIVPVLLDDTPVVSELAQFQWLDFRDIVRRGRIAAAKEIASGVPVGAAFIPLLGAVVGQIVAHLLLSDVGIKVNGEDREKALQQFATRLRPRP